MRWKSDWLARLILREVEKIWTRARKDGEGQCGPCCDYLVVRQFEVQFRPVERPEYQGRCKDLLQYAFVGQPQGQWIFDGDGIRSADVSGIYDSGPRRGMFYTVGFVRFGVAPDRKRVALDYLVGPLYGQGRVLRVRGQGSRGTLELDPDYLIWQS